MQGTSWLNRPFYIGAAAGGLFMTNGPNQNIRGDNDLVALINAGWEWDYYWGLEWRVARATPELINDSQPTAVRNDRWVLTDLSLIYFPTGDTVVRPYARLGVGWTEIDFPDDSGGRHEASPFTMPFGIGVKWPFRRWLAGRVELTDNLAFADDGSDTLNNLTLTLGLEYRWGVKPKSYWPWYPGRHIK
jgi:hypothetical protein